MKTPAINSVTAVSALVLALVISLYLFTPVFDEWIIQKSLKRFCEHQKEAFSGEFYSPAYLCSFIEGTE